MEGEEIRITPLPPYPSRRWVREAMLLAGYAAAHLALREGLPFPFATQEAPIRRVQGEGLAALWEQRKALKRAQLKAVPAPHKGLGLPLYAQVTSPLRRYLDLVAHQQLRAWLKGERPLSHAELLERVGAAEAVADLVREAERKSRLHWTLLYLMEQGYSRAKRVSKLGKSAPWKRRIPSQSRGEGRARSTAVLSPISGRRKTPCPPRFSTRTPGPWYPCSIR